jgi:hypothetical protein
MKLMAACLSVVLVSLAAGASRAEEVTWGPLPDGSTRADLDDNGMPLLRKGPGGACHVSILDLFDCAEMPDLRRKFEGKTVNLIGRYFRDGRLSFAFRIKRLSMWCCAADATPLSVRVIGKSGVPVADGVWIEVRAVVNFRDNGKEFVPELTMSDMRTIPVPAEIYML